MCKCINVFDSVKRCSNCGEHISVASAVTMCSLLCSGHGRQSIGPPRSRTWPTTVVKFASSCAMGSTLVQSSSTFVRGVGLSNRRCFSCGM